MAKISFLYQKSSTASPAMVTSLRVPVRGLLSATTLTQAQSRCLLLRVPGLWGGLLAGWLGASWRQSHPLLSWC